MTSRMVGSVLTLVILLSSVVGGAAQTYTQMQWGVNKGVMPYAFGANINGAWRDLGTVSSGGVWSIPSTNVGNLSEINSSNYASTNVGLNQAIIDAIAQKKTLIISGTITASDTIGASLSSDISIKCNPGAKIVAAAGFPAGKKLVQFVAGVNVNFSWSGCYFDAQNVPNSAPGQANDTFSLGFAGANSVNIDNIECYAGADYLIGGSDSCLFIGYTKSARVTHVKGTGYPDAVIYMSGGSLGDGSTEVTRDVEFDDVSCVNGFNGFIIKRRSKRLYGGNVFSDNCVNGLVLGAEASTGDGITRLDIADVHVNSVIANNTDTALILRYIDNASVDSVISNKAGRFSAAGAGYSSSGAAGVQLQGAQNSHVGYVRVDGLNPLLTSTPTARGVYVLPRTVNSITRNSTGNFISNISTNGITRAVQEDNADQSYNSYTLLVDANTLGSATAGVGSVIMRQYITSDPVADPVNFLNVKGAAAGSASGPSIGITGSDANSSMTIAAKGTGVILMNGPAGLETLRIGNTAGSNAGLEISGDATAGVKISARNGGTNEGLLLAAKSDLVQFLAPSTGSPTLNSYCGLVLASNTSLELHCRGSDGVDRKVALTIAP